MSANPGAAELGAFTLGGDDEHTGPSAMSVSVTQAGRLDIAVEPAAAMSTVVA